MVIEDIDPEEYDTEVEVVAAAGTTPAQPEQVRDTAIELYNSGASRHMSPFHKRFIIRGLSNSD